MLAPMPLWLLLVLLSVFALGLGTAFPVSTVSSQNAVARSQIGTITGATNFFRALMASFTVAVFSAILLMALGSQWYVLFNTIAGAISIPNDLREMAASLRLTRRQRWEKLILPAIFPAYVTGGITAAGGAWNASIVAEVAGWGSHHLSAIGLGAYIADAADSSGPDHFGRVLIGVVVMSIFVVGVNRLFWRRLYRLAETRYAL